MQLTTRPTNPTSVIQAPGLGRTDPTDAETVAGSFAEVMDAAVVDEGQADEVKKPGEPDQNTVNEALETKETLDDPVFGAAGAIVLPARHLVLFDLANPPTSDVGAAVPVNVDTPAGAVEINLASAEIQSVAVMPTKAATIEALIQQQSAPGDNLQVSVTAAILDPQDTALLRLAATEVPVILKTTGTASNRLADRHDIDLDFPETIGPKVLSFQSAFALISDGPLQNKQTLGATQDILVDTGLDDIGNGIEMNFGEELDMLINPLLHDPGKGVAPGSPLALTKAATVTSIAQQMMPLLTEAEGKTVEVLLDPKDLGKLHFSMIQKGEGMMIALVVERRDTLDLLRRNADQLLQEMRNAGFHGNSLSFAQSDQNNDRPPRRFAPVFTHESGVMPGAASFASSGPSPQANHGSDRSLDIRL